MIFQGLLGNPIVNLAVVLVTTGTVVVGLFIAYQAVRGLLRNDSRQMLYLSIGMVLLFGVAYALAFVVSVLLWTQAIAVVWQDLLQLAVRLVQLSGLVCIAYSMYTD